MEIGLTIFIWMMERRAFRVLGAGEYGGAPSPFSSATRDAIGAMECRIYHWLGWGFIFAFLDEWREAGVTRGNADDCEGKGLRESNL